VTTRWSGGSDPSWDNAANWSNGVPSAGQTAAEFLGIAKDAKVILKGTASANYLQFTAQRSDSDGDLTLAAQKGASLILECQQMEPGFAAVFICSNRGGIGKFHVAIDADTHIGKPLQTSKAIPAISCTRDFILSLRGSLTMESAINFGGTEESRIEILGDLSHSGLRFGSAGEVAIAGSGKTADSLGTVNFAGGTVILGRPRAISGRAYRMEGATVRLEADGAIASPSDLSVVGQATLESGGHGASFGTLSITGEGVLHIVLAKNSAISFADSSSSQWAPSAKLIIENYTPGKTSVSFGTGTNGLTDSQLSATTINGKPTSLDSKGILQQK